MPRQRFAKSLPGAQAYQTILRAFRTLWSISKRYVVGSLLLALMRAAEPIAMLWLTKQLVDVLTTSGSVKEAALFAIVMGVVKVVNTVVFGVLDLKLDRLRELISISSRLSFLETLGRISSLAPFDDPKFYDRMLVAQRAGMARIPSFMSDMSASISALVGVIAPLVILSRFAPFTLVLVVASAIPAILIRHIAHQADISYMWSSATPDRSQGYWWGILLGRAAATEIRLYNAFKWFHKRWLESAHLQMELGQAQRWRRYYLSVLGVLADQITFVIVLIYIVASALVVRPSAGDWVFYLGLTQQAGAAIAAFANVFNRLNESSTLLMTYFKFIDEYPLETQELNDELVPTSLALNQGITFTNVAFRYQGAEENALDGASFSIPAGAISVLVGANGSGKSTVLKLLTRLYDPISGQICIDHHDIQNISLGRLRANIGVVLQQFGSYYASIYENVAMAAYSIDRDDDGVQHVLETVGLQSKINRLSKGHHAVLGREIADGCELSTGELQKLAIARALYRNPQILLLDEATFALDAESEQRFLTTLKSLSGRTIMIVSHRLSTIRAADWICVLDRGKVVEEGTFEQLAMSEGPFSKLMRHAQNKDRSRGMKDHELIL